MIDKHEIDQVVNMYLPLFNLQVNIEGSESEKQVSAVVTVNEKSYNFSEDKKSDLKKQWKHFSKSAVYYALQEYTGKSFEWGSHTGVRPIAMVHALREQGVDVEQALALNYHFSDKTIALCKTIADIQEPLLNDDEKNIDIYIGIPFCKSRCTYCSFSLVGIERKGKLQPSYTDCLCAEIDQVGKAVLQAGYKVRCIYIGGGTPTALENIYLEKVLKKVDDVFPDRVEFTLEAGRPDTITVSNLTLAKRLGVTRISINPQTVHQKTLDKIGRKHSVSDIEDAFKIAREIGFDNINMDIIAGLPEEDINDFKKTLDWVYQLRPEAITVHTFALKRSSALKKQDYQVNFDDSVRAMLDYAYESLNGYHPYYLYRQKNMEDNGENVGFSLPTKECVYNIDIMQEDTHILAMGSGGVSKRIHDGGLVRTSDPKDVELYIERINDTIDKNIKFLTL